jgi:hypothetical protein
LRCQEIAYWGLVPGVSSESTLEHVARNGWILTVTFLEGDTSTVQPVDAPGVDEYRAWVQENFPDRFETLFAFGVSMRLDTEERRALHKETVAEYLAATS